MIHWVSLIDDKKRTGVRLVSLYDTRKKISFVLSNWSLTYFSSSIFSARQTSFQTQQELIGKEFFITMLQWWRLTLCTLLRNRLILNTNTKQKESISLRTLYTLNLLLITSRGKKEGLDILQRRKKQPRFLLILSNGNDQNNFDLKSSKEDEEKVCCSMKIDLNGMLNQYDKMIFNQMIKSKRIVIVVQIRFSSTNIELKTFTLAIQCAFIYSSEKKSFRVSSKMWNQSEGKKIVIKRKSFYTNHAFSLSRCKNLWLLAYALPVLCISLCNFNRWRKKRFFLLQMKQFDNWMCGDDSTIFIFLSSVYYLKVFKSTSFFFSSHGKI